MIKYLILTILLIILLILNLFFEIKLYENFYSRPNKCFDCEKDIKDPNKAYLAFSSKCFDCDRQNINFVWFPFNFLLADPN